MPAAMRSAASPCVNDVLLLLPRVTTGMSFTGLMCTDSDCGTLHAVLVWHTDAVAITLRVPSASTILPMVSKRTDWSAVANAKAVAVAAVAVVAAVADFAVCAH